MGRQLPEKGPKSMALSAPPKSLTIHTALHLRLCCALRLSAYADTTLPTLSCDTTSSACCPRQLRAFSSPRCLLEVEQVLLDGELPPPTLPRNALFSATCSSLAFNSAPRTSTFAVSTASPPVHLASFLARNLDAACHRHTQYI